MYKIITKKELNPTVTLMEIEAPRVAKKAEPGHPALYPFYRALVREWITSSNRNCDIKVLGSERLRYSVYDGGKIYLLNTDFDMPIIVKVINGKKETLVELNPLELKIIE